MKVAPQKGPQEDFLSTPADICIYGGAAGGGKTFGLLLENLRHIDVRNFGSVIFRRESSQIANEGGPWDTALDIFPKFGFTPVESPKHMFKSKKRKVKITFSHLQYDKHVKQWDGAQVPLICFDELQHFTEKQFWYMLSRNRSTCGVKPYMRATCNPDPDSFLRDLLSWWIDQETGDPIKERSGVIRYFVRLEGAVYWADTAEELVSRYSLKVLPKSFTFIMSSLSDNPALMEADPDYEANIEAMLDYEKKRLKGNWFARPTAGELFRREYFDVVESDYYDESLVVQSVRYWDRAATVPSEVNPDPDWSVGLKMDELVNGDLVISDIARARKEPADIETLIHACTVIDGRDTILALEQEPGASGKMEVSYYERKYTYIDVQVFKKTKGNSKLVCWKPVARATKQRHIKVLRAPWNRDFFSELEAVTDGTQDGHDDQADTLAGAFNCLTSDDHGSGVYKEN